MIGALLGFVTGGSWRLYLYGSLALVALGYVGWTQIALGNRAEKIEALTGERDEAVRVAKANEAAIVQIEARHREAMLAVQMDLEAARKARQRIVVVKEGNARDPDAREPVAAPIRRYLERVRDVPAGETPNRSPPR